MRIHTVKEGDTVFKIARSYSVPPAKIIENNALINPDRLYPGQKLIILMPTRSYTVRGGDTLDSIAIRFGVDKSELRRNNPALMGGERIYPGQILAVKYESKPFGNAVTNGYFSKNCEKESLSLFLPHLSYITFAAFKWEGRKLSKLFNYEAALEAAKRENALPVLRVYTEEPFCEIKNGGFAESVISEAANEGFFAVSFAGKCTKEKGFSDFFAKFRDKLHSSGLEAHVELDGNSEIECYGNLSENADLTLLNYETSSNCDFDSSIGAFLKKYSETLSPEKTLFDLFPSICFGEKQIDFQELEKLIISRGITPYYSEKAKCSEFKLSYYTGGKKEEIEISFPTPENTIAKLELLAELGYMGASFDIAKSTVASLMCFNSLFHAVKLTGGKGNSCRGED